MPFNYPRIEFDHEGVCNFCSNHKKNLYEGADALKEKILSCNHKGKNQKYDCAVGFSGGRDSSYLLYFLSAVLKLKVIAFTIDNGNLPPETQDNINNITNLLNIDLVIKKYTYLEKCSKYHLKTWLHHPSAAMISALCTGCRLGLAKGIYELMLEYNVPVYISGATPFEGNQFKTNLLRIPIKSNRKNSLILGYLSQTVKNPRWISNSYCSFIQANEFMAFYGGRYNKMLKQKGYIRIYPFHTYIRWEEKKVIDVIEKELKWQKNSQTGSTWRGDCDTALLKLYLYKKLLGYNDKDDSLSDLIRDEQLSREEALQRLEREHEISETAIKNIVEKNGINYLYFQKIVNSISKVY